MDLPKRRRRDVCWHTWLSLQHSSMYSSRPSLVLLLLLLLDSGSLPFTSALVSDNDCFSTLFSSGQVFSGETLVSSTCSDTSLCSSGVLPEGPCCSPSPSLSMWGSGDEQNSTECTEILSWGCLGSCVSQSCACLTSSSGRTVVSEFRLQEWQDDSRLWTTKLCSEPMGVDGELAPLGRSTPESSDSNLYNLGKWEFEKTTGRKSVPVWGGTELSFRCESVSWTMVRSDPSCSEVETVWLSAAQSLDARTLSWKLLKNLSLVRTTSVSKTASLSPLPTRRRRKHQGEWKDWQSWEFQMVSLSF